MARPSTNKEASIVSFFNNSPVATANVVFGIVRAVLKERNGVALASAAAPKAKAIRKVKSRRAKKAAAASVPAAEAAPAPVEEGVAAVQ